MKSALLTALLLTTSGLCAPFPAAAQEGASADRSTAVMDVGTLDRARASQLYAAKPPYSPYAGKPFPSRPFFGDTHLHTAVSFDAGAFGARLTPRDAYKFAKGEEVTSSSGLPARLSRPLDFLVVADHSDNMGFFPDLLAGKPSVMADPTGRKWHDEIQSGKGADAAIEIIMAFSQGKFPPDLMYSPDSKAFRSTWQDTIAAAEENNDPGRFTAFIGYEWTSNTGGNNLHRNVIFRDNGQKASQVAALHGDQASRQRQSARPVEVDGGLRGEDGRRRARHPSQRQSVERPDVSDDRAGDRQAARPPICRNPQQVGAALRSHPDEGGRRGAPIPVTERRVRGFRDLGQGQSRSQRRKEAGDAGA